MKHRETTADHKKQIEQMLNSCDSLGAMLEILQNQYNLFGVKLSLSKKIYVAQLLTLLTTLNPELK